MLEAEATLKVCPLMSNPLSQGMGGDTTFIHADITISLETFCIGSRCMSWESNFTGIEQAAGYCKLMEQNSGNF